MRDIDIAAVDSLKALDPKRPIREGGILAKDPAQVCLTEHDQVVDAFSSDRADQSLRVTVLPCDPGAIGLSRMPMARSRRVTAAP